MVTRGYSKLYTNNDCPMSYDVLGSCFGNNPAAPYVLPYGESHHETLKT